MPYLYGPLGTIDLHQKAPLRHNSFSNEDLARLNGTNRLPFRYLEKEMLFRVVFMELKSLKLLPRGRNLSLFVKMRVSRVSESDVATCVMRTPIQFDADFIRVTYSLSIFEG